MFNRVRVSNAFRYFIYPVTLVLLTALTLAACDSGTSAVPPSKKSFDGKTLFKGLYFGDGEAAGEFSYIWNHHLVVEELSGMSADQIGEVRLIQKDVIAWIDQGQPDFFDEFSAALTSGDHLLIQAQLKKSSELIETALSAVTELTTADLRKGPDSISKDDTGVVLVLVLVAAVVVVVVAVIGTDSEDVSQLQQEELINQIATSLAV